MENKQNIIIYKTQDGKAALSLYARDGSVWMNQNQIAELFDTSVPNISMHISNILKDNELDANSVIKDYLTTATDGKNYEVAFYSLDMILAIGFRVRSKRGTQFRQWANRNLKEYMIKGFVMDDERLKNPNGRPDYFDELLARIRDIRASEKRFYQKIRDLFSISNDYDKTDKVTAKNYLTEDEIDTLNRLVVVFLETAELRAKNRQDITMDFWRENVDRILEFNDKKLLKGKGSISNVQMEKKVGELYDEFHHRRKIADAQKADLEDLEQIELLEKQIKERK